MVFRPLFTLLCSLKHTLVIFNMFIIIFFSNKSGMHSCVLFEPFSSFSRTFYTISYLHLLILLLAILYVSL